MNRFAVLIAAVLLMYADLSASFAHAASADRIAVEARVRAEVSKDLALPWRAGESLAGRGCLDGRPVKDFPGDIAEYWVNLECAYCGIREPMSAQRQNADVCIVVRHTPSREYGESLKKALSYEALKAFSLNAANLFWDKVLPKNALPLPMPYEGALLTAFQEAAVTPETFTDALKSATETVNQDIAAAQGRITSTPTWVLFGIRFSACDFTAAQLPEALEWAKKARADDEEARERVITIITNGLVNETML